MKNYYAIRFNNGLHTRSLVSTRHELDEQGCKLFYWNDGSTSYASDDYTILKEYHGKNYAAIKIQYIKDYPPTPTALADLKLLPSWISPQGQLWQFSDGGHSSTADKLCIVFYSEHHSTGWEAEGALLDKHWMKLHYNGESICDKVSAKQRQTLKRFLALIQKELAADVGNTWLLDWQNSIQEKINFN